MSNEIARTQAVLTVLKKNAKGELSKEKPSVPVYVNDWFARNAVAYCDMFEYRLLELARNPHQGNDVSDTLFYTWLTSLGFDYTIEILVKMYNNGYTVDEPKYIVKMKGLNEGSNYLNHHVARNRWLFDSRDCMASYKTHFTRKELEDAGFADVFNSSLFEVEKVK